MDDKSIELQKLLQDFYYSTKSIVKQIELTMPIIQDQISMNRDLIVKHKGEEGKKIIDDIFTRLLPENPLSVDEMSQVNERIVEELEKNGFNVIAKRIDGMHIEFDLEEMFDKAFELSILQKSIYDNAVVSLITYYENFLGELSKFHLLNNKNHLNGTQKIEISKVLDYSTIKDILIDFVNVEVEEILKLSPKDIHDRIYQYGYNDKFYKAKKSIILEIFARRNSIIHCNSIADSQYIKSSGNIYKIKKGTRIITDIEYIRDSVQTLLTNVVILTANEWEKTKVLYDENAIDNLNNAIERIAFKTLSAEKWEHSYYMYEVLKDFKKFRFYQEIFVLNYLLSGKMLGLENVIDEIERYNYTSREINYKMGFLGLICDYDELISLIENSTIIPITSFHFLKWPIFCELRVKDPEKFSKILQLCDEKEKLN